MNSIQCMDKIEFWLRSAKLAKDTGDIAQYKKLMERAKKWNNRLNSIDKGKGIV